MKHFGVATFNIDLHITNARGVPMKDTPLLLRFRKECRPRGVYDVDPTAISLTPTLQGSVYIFAL